MMCICEVLHLYLPLISILNGWDERTILTTWNMSFQMFFPCKTFTAIGTKDHVDDGMISEIHEQEY